MVFVDCDECFHEHYDHVHDHHLNHFNTVELSHNFRYNTTVSGFDVDNGHILGLLLEAQLNDMIAN